MKLLECLENLEELRIELLQIEATKANRETLDKAYMAVKTAIEQVNRLVATEPVKID